MNAIKSAPLKKLSKGTYMGETPRDDASDEITLGDSAFFMAQDRYIKNVVPHPEIIYEDEKSYVARYYPFAEIFLRTRSVSSPSDKSKFEQLRLISRAEYQPSGADKTKSPRLSEPDLRKYYNQLFFWNMLWIPVKCEPIVKISEPSDLNSKLPYKTFSREIDLSNFWTSKGQPKVSFIVERGAEQSVVVFRVTTPIFDMTVNK